MSNAETSTEIAVSILEDALKDMTIHLRFFSLSMRSLYSDKNVGTSNDVARRFTELRDKTKDDAKVYLKVILPLTTKFVSSIKEFFEFYEALTYEEWCEMLPTIVEEVKNQKDLVETLKNMHEAIMVTLKEREDEAKIIMTEFKDLQSKYEAMTKELKGKADTRYWYANALAIVPVVNIIACPLLKLSAKEYTAMAVAKTAESETQGAAALVVAETLIPALSSFIEGLTKAAGFFQIMEVELESFAKKGEASSRTPVEAHYIMMRKKVEKIHPSTYEYYASLPAVRTDFEAIPDVGAEKNYIEKWLQAKLTEIAEKRSSTRSAFWDVIKGIKGLTIKPQICLLFKSDNKE